MKVETYEVEQANSEATSLATDGAAWELVEMLGLTGQKRLIEPKTATRNPYRAMTKQEGLVYGALLTEKKKLEDYDVDAIPLRVLQVAAHAKETGLFKELQIWYAEPYVLKDDPILVGQIETTPYNYAFHMLARWGESLQTLEQLEAVAVNVLRKLRLDDLRVIADQVANLTKQMEITNNLKTLASKPNFYP